MSEEPENWARLHPATLAIRALERLPELVLGLPAAAYFIGDTGIVVALFLAGAGLAASMLFAFVYWRRFTYWVGPEQLVIESGIVNRNRRTIPFDRIQDVSLEQKLLARLFGVSIVRIETGSSGGDEGELDCVSRAEADRLRDRIRAYRAGNAEREYTVDEGKGEALPPLYAMDFRRLVVAGLFNFSLVFLAILGGVWQYLGSYLPAEYLDPSRWVGAYRKEAVGLISALSILSFAMLLLLVGIVTGLMRTIARDFGFRLTRTETGLRRERGLFTRTDVVIPLRRVQAGIVSTGIIKRLFGWSGLAVQSLGSDGNAGTHHEVSPLATSDELVPVLDELSMPLPPPARDFVRVSPKLIWRSWTQDGLALGIAVLIAAFFWNGWPLLLAAAPFLLIAPLLQYHAHGYCFWKDVLFVRRGFWRPRVTILPLAKAQSATLVRGLTQQGFGLATLAIGTAGASLASPLRILDLEEDTARNLLGERMLLD
ncbi:PH domain-containing protein [Parasphingopyxis lamellibrachiae]|uniref:Putative membrane protein n=1 Tax=Parasphingopyxis lamellibrachiae TaxID=680125 RepID=A0A3D9FIR2_9SPHN|nr:PH domain-containing protein [Parasphingopyxis lamellibrachiae]RED17679.1 putative membrane protein [Parasphingopyxis lamellibrachiae]